MPSRLERVVRAGGGRSDAQRHSSAGEQPGDLPETIGDVGFLFDIPALHAADPRRATAEEVEPWVETISAPWDDAAEYDRWMKSRRAVACGALAAGALAAVYRDSFAGVHRQPGPPLAPGRDAVGWASEPVSSSTDSEVHPTAPRGDRRDCRCGSSAPPGRGSSWSATSGRARTSS